MGREGTLVGRVAWPLALDSRLSPVRPFCGIRWRNQSCIVELALGLETGKLAFVSQWCLCGHLAGSLPCCLSRHWRRPCAQAHRGHLKGAWHCDGAESLQPHGVSIAACGWLGCMRRRNFGVVAQKGREFVRGPVSPPLIFRLRETRGSHAGVGWWRRWCRGPR